MVVKKLKLESWEQKWVDIEKKCFHLNGQPIKRMQERMILKRKIKYF
jgi:hypothetical protein